MNWNKTFKKVEEALGFKLYNWQKEYIRMDCDDMPSYRACGRTTAFVLRYLLNYEVKICRSCLKLPEYYNWAFPIDEEHGKNYKREWYPWFVKDIDTKLKHTGLETYFH